MYATDLNDEGAFDLLAYKYKTNKKNNEYEIFIIFSMLKKELFSMSYAIGTEEMVIDTIEEMN